MRSRFAIWVGVAAAAGCIAATTEAFADDTAPPPAAAPPTQAPTPAETPQPPETGNHPAPNSVYAEGLGAGIVYSLNYERLVTDDVGVRVGFGYLSFGASAGSGTQSASANASLLMIPVTASYIGIRSGKSALELGGGATIAYASGSVSGVGASASGSGVLPYGVLLVGYRLHPVDHAGFQFRVGLMAIMGEGLALSNADPTKIGVLPWGYLSLGASF